MSNFDIGVVGFVLTLVVIMLRVPVGLAMILVGLVGYSVIAGPLPLLNTLKTVTFSRFSNYTLSVVPLFLLMGEFATKGGLSHALFRAARAWLGHWPGGLAIATIGGSAAFGAICGSSIATAATMSQVAMPEMRRYGYSDALSTGTLAAGGTLGILIPPSVILVIYAVYTEQSIGQLFLAAIVPGVMAAIQYMIVVALYVRVVPGSGPAGPRLGIAERLRASRELGPSAGVFLLVVIGIYQGWFSPTEGAAVGAAAVGAIAATLGGMRWRAFREALLATAETTAMVFLILLGAELFGAFLALTQMPADLARLVDHLALPPVLIVIVILLVYLALGCVMESLSIVLLTLPVFTPILLALDLGMTQTQIMIWFGILVLISVEVGMISPPFGMNLFVINAMAKTVPMRETYRGVIGFCGMDVLRLVMIVLWPASCLWLAGLG